MLLPHIDITSTFGTTLIGSSIAMMLYGLTTLQTYLYYTNCLEDPRSTKAFVAIIWVLDSLHSAFMVYSVYFYLVLSYFNPASLAVGHWSLNLSIAFNTVISCIVQIFFLIRIHQCLPFYFRPCYPVK
ncbi:hypothetical protein HYPSUDRAFT_36343 [Hypholoma sublateritium FD-334 SS-4]|uniref:Uncharacterized protein n=1 Tax=Hypholoma sublateritium (strain FD-334 SS-4) TaxID=945553 RepID=A0A0D2MRJ8_HYPSF|nr:hypothetical protein HYPSUDRAFT_36343 [Hypholoma sublateritium FD-334 SS-4]